MMRRIDKNRSLVLVSLPALFVGCALGIQGDPPPPEPNPIAGEGGEGQTGGTGMMGGTSSGGSSGAGGSSSGAAGSTTGGASGSTSTGGSAGSTSTGGASGQGGSSGSTTGGTGGMTGGSGGMTGGSAGKGGTGGMTGGSAGKGGSSGSTSGGAGAGGGAAGGPPGGMELLRDNFEMDSGLWSPSPAANWARAMDGGSMAYVASGAMQNTNWRVAYAGQTTWTDVQIDARVRADWAGDGSGYYAGICARYQSASAYACFALRSNGQIMFRVNGSNTGATNPQSGAIQRNMWYAVRVIARGSNITAFVNGTEIPTGSRVVASDNPPASGRIALAAPGTNAAFDDIVVTTPQ